MTREEICALGNAVGDSDLFVRQAWRYLSDNLYTGPFRTTHSYTIEMVDCLRAAKEGDEFALELCRKWQALAVKMRLKA